MITWRSRPWRLSGSPSTTRRWAATVYPRLRIPVGTVLGQLAAGREVREILEDFLDLEPADILAALEYAAAAVQERELPLTAR